MISPDTNVLVRVLTNDDEKQADLAAEVLSANDVFLAKTVLLELEWVLRYSYEFDRDSSKNWMNWRRATISGRTMSHRSWTVADD